MANIIQIQQQDNSQLSKKQAEFNRLNVQIKNLSETIALMQTEFPKFYERTTQEIDPLTDKLIALRKETIRMGEQILSKHFTKKKERETLINVLLELMDTMPEMDDEIIALYDKVTNGSYEEDLKEAQMAEFLHMKDMVESVSGEKLPPEIDSAEKLMEYLENQTAEHYEKEDERRRKAAEKRQQTKESRPKTARQMEQERIAAEKKAKKEAEERIISKSVRELYMELAKTFHPDLEPDENEKVRKTEIMQRLTAAYEEDNLLALFQIQLELECLDPNTLTNLSEEKINAFIRVLKGQKKALQYELDHITFNITRILGKKVSVETLDQQFKKHIESEKRVFKKRIKEAEELLAIFSNPNSLRAWLR